MPLGPLVSHAARERLPGHLSVCLRVPSSVREHPQGSDDLVCSYPQEEIFAE